VIAVGFIANGPDSYIRNPWNILDFILVIFAVTFTFPLGGDLAALKVIRMARVLKPLRVVSRNQNLRLSIQCLIIAIPAIGSLIVIILLLMFIFGIMSVNLFKGLSYFCNTA
jgi:hypothetical protein